MKCNFSFLIIVSVNNKTKFEDASSDLLWTLLNEGVINLVNVVVRLFIIIFLKTEGYFHWHLIRNIILTKIKVHCLKQTFSLAEWFFSCQKPCNLQQTILK